MLFGMQVTMNLHKDAMIKGRGCPEIDCTETYAHCYILCLILTFTVCCRTRIAETTNKDVIVKAFGAGANLTGWFDAVPVF